MMTFEGLRRHLVGMVGSDNVWTDDVRLAAHAIDRRQPRLVCSLRQRPRQQRLLLWLDASALRWCRGDRAPKCTWGRRQTL